MKQDQSYTRPPPIHFLGRKKSRRTRTGTRSRHPQRSHLQIMSAWGNGGTAKSCNALLKRVEDNDPLLEELLILPSKNFGGIEVDRLSAAIANGTNTRLKSLQASGHEIPPSSLRSLGLAIGSQSIGEGCDGMVRLAIGHSEMGDEGVIAFCSALSDVDGGRLEHLDLGYKGTSKEGMAAIGSAFSCSRSLRHLDVSRNKGSGEDGISALFDAAKARRGASDEPTFPSLEYLNLSECCDLMGVECARGVCSGLLQNGAPRNMTLILNSNPFKANVTLALSPLMSTITSLSLQSCDIGDEGIAHLLSSLEEAHNPTLSYLDLSKNKIGLPGATSLSKSLKSLSNLKELNLSHNLLMGTEGVTILCRALKHKNDALRILDLSQTDCGSDGAAAALEIHHITQLRLFNNRLQSEGFEHLASVLKGIYLQDGDCKLSALEGLDLGGNSAGSEAVASLLKALLPSPDGRGACSLRVLEIGGNMIGEEAELALKELTEKMPQIDVARDRPVIKNQMEGVVNEISN